VAADGHNCAEFIHVLLGGDCFGSKFARD
jgi:hypothetical protein